MASATSKSSFADHDSSPQQKEAVPMRLIFFLFVIFAMPLVASAAGFDCRKAASRVEKLICVDAELSGLDDELTAAYRAARRAVMPESENRKQRQWIVERNACDSRIPA